MKLDATPSASKGFPTRRRYHAYVYEGFLLGRIVSRFRTLKRKSPGWMRLMRLMCCVCVEHSRRVGFGDTSFGVSRSASINSNVFSPLTYLLTKKPMQSTST